MSIKTKSIVNEENPALTSGQKIWAVVRELGETIIFSLAIILIIYIFLFQPNEVDGPSMHPTLINEQYILTNKIVYRFSQPKRGDIVIFHAPKVACSAGMGNCTYIKRIIGVPGDTVSIEEGKFVVNGEVLAEDYLPANTLTQSHSYINGQTITLKGDEFFVVGDNRAESSDSRIWGPITRDAIIGKAFFSYRPLSRFGKI